MLDTLATGSCAQLRCHDLDSDKVASDHAQVLKNYIRLICLYTIHGQRSGYTVPCVYALLPNKRKESYIQLFRQVKSWLDIAVLDVFPGIGEEGCFFYLSKRLDVQVKWLGLMLKY